MNNLKETDYVNCVIQNLVIISDLRDFFLLFNAWNPKQDISTQLGILFRKIFNKRNFKSQVSPHELLQSVSKKSNKRFKIEKRSDPYMFLVWMLNSLHLELKNLKGTCKRFFKISYNKRFIYGKFGNNSK